MSQQDPFHFDRRDLFTPDIDQVTLAAEHANPSELDRTSATGAGGSGAAVDAPGGASLDDCTTLLEPMASRPERLAELLSERERTALVGNLSALCDAHPLAEDACKRQHPDEHDAALPPNAAAK